jgi:predicted nucleic acid-binding protein
VILVDSSVWIDYFNGTLSAETDLLDRLLGGRELLVGDLILAEVLQVFRSESDARRALERFAAFECRTMGGLEVAIEAAGNYRLLRRKGVTVRTTVDTLIATFCMIEGHELLHGDRDFDPFVRYLGLRVVKARPQRHQSERFNPHAQIGGADGMGQLADRD